MSSAYCSNTFHRSLRPTSSLAFLTYASTVRAIRRRYVPPSCWMRLVLYNTPMVPDLHQLASARGLSSPDGHTSFICSPLSPISKYVIVLGTPKMVNLPRRHNLILLRWLRPNP